MPLRTTSDPILKRKGGVSIGRLVDGLRNQKVPNGPQLAEAFNSLGTAVNELYQQLGTAKPAINDLMVVDSTGKPILWAGDQPPYGGLWSEQVYIGPGGPANAPFFCDGSHVIIGKNGAVMVQDPYGEPAAWIGTEYDVLPVVSCADAGGSDHLVRLEITGHPFLAGDVLLVFDVNHYANGAWTVTKIDANHIDLQASLFGGAYSGGGTVTRLLHISGAADNGDGLIRLTVASHGYESGDRVNVLGVGGVPNATGQWVIEVNDANTFDLVDSTWGGGYTSGGTCVRYFGGGLFQTFAIGDSFANYKLRAFANGDLRIKNASISVSGISSLGDPFSFTVDDGQVIVEGKYGAMNSTLVMTGGYVAIMSPDYPSLRAELSPAGIFLDGAVDGYGAGFYANVFGMDPYVAFRDAGFNLLFGVNATGAVDAVGPYKVGGTTVISQAKDGTLNSLSLTVPLVVSSGGTGSGTASGARGNLSVYSKAEVDSMIATINTALSGKAAHGTYTVTGGNVTI